MIRLRKSRYDRRPERSRSVHCCTGIRYCETDTGHYLRLDSTFGNGLQVAHKQCQTNSNLNPLVSQQLELHRRRLTGANGVTSCFSAANIRTDMTRAAVMNISIKTPCARFVP